MVFPLLSYLRRKKWRTHRFVHTSASCSYVVFYGAILETLALRIYIITMSRYEFFAGQICKIEWLDFYEKRYVYIDSTNRLQKLLAGIWNFRKSESHVGNLISCHPNGYCIMFFLYAVTQFIYDADGLFITTQMAPACIVYSLCGLINKIPCLIIWVLYDMCDFWYILSASHCDIMNTMCIGTYISLTRSPEYSSEYFAQELMRNLYLTYFFLVQLRSLSDINDSGSIIVLGQYVVPGFVFSTTLAQLHISNICLYCYLYVKNFSNRNYFCTIQTQYS